mgnify:CR=1 FL=1
MGTHLSRILLGNWSSRLIKGPQNSLSKKISQYSRTLQNSLFKKNQFLTWKKSRKKIRIVSRSPVRRSNLSG